MTINEILQQLGISNLDQVSGFQQQFANDIDLNRFGRFLPQFNQNLFQQAFDLGVGDIASQRDMASQDFSTALSSNLFAGQTGLMGAQPMATGFSNAGGQQRQMQNFRRGASQAFESDIYGANRARQQQELDFRGAEQDLIGALQSQITGFQGDVRRSILNLLQLDPTDQDNSVDAQNLPTTPPLMPGLQNFQNNMNNNFGNMGNPQFGDFDYETYYNELFNNMNQGMV